MKIKYNKFILLKNFNDIGYSEYYKSGDKDGKFRGHVEIFLDDFVEIEENDIIIDVEKLEKSCKILYDIYVEKYLNHYLFKEHLDYNFEDTVVTIHIVPNEVLIIYPEKYHTEEYAKDKYYEMFYETQFTNFPEMIIKRLLE